MKDKHIHETANVEEITCPWIDVSRRALLVMKGPDAEDLIQRISTNDVSGLSNGKPVQTVFTNEKGRIVEVVTALTTDEGILLAGQSDRSDLLAQWLERFIIMEDVTVIPVSANFRHVLAFGPTSELSGTPEMIRFQEPLGDVDLLHFLIPRAISAPIPGLAEVPAKDGVFVDFRIEHGIPSWPAELNENYNPLEAGLETLVSWTKGCYVGQEVIARLDTYKKVQKHLFGLECDGRPDDLPAKLMFNGKEAGLLTSVSSHHKERWHPGLGYVRSAVEKESVFTIGNGTQEIKVRRRK